MSNIEIQEPRADHLLRNLAIFVTLIIQFGVLIWGAAQIKTSVDDLTETMKEVRADLKTVTNEMVSIKIDHARLEPLLAPRRTK